MGGRHKTLDSTTGQLDAYDPAADAWTTLAPMPTPRGGLAMVAFEGRLVVLGGEVAGTPRLLDAAEQYDPASGAWSAFPKLQRPRTGLGADAWDGRIVVVSGASPGGAPGSDAPEVYGPVAAASG